MHAVSGLFHSHPWVLFAFPSRYCALSVAGSYLALEGGPPAFAPGFTCPGLLLNRTRAPARRKGLSPAAARLSRRFRQAGARLLRPAPRMRAVWAPPASLAATGGISVDFFSSGYWDVSVPRVCPRIAAGPRPKPGGFSHSGPRGSKAGAPRPGVSPLPAPFVAGLRLGIPRVHFLYPLYLYSPV